jgi:hypothetical protein
MSPDKDDEPTQITPAGAEIPVPDREDVLDAFRKIASSSDDVEREHPGR